MFPLAKPESKDEQAYSVVEAGCGSFLPRLRRRQTGQQQYGVATCSRTRGERLESASSLTCDAHTKDPMQPVSWRPQSTSHSVPSPHSSGLGPREAQLASMRREYCGSLFYLSLGGLSLCPGPPPREPCIWLFSSEGLRASGSGNRILVGVIQRPVRGKLGEEGFISAQIPGDSPSL